MLTKEIVNKSIRILSALSICMLLFSLSMKAQIGVNSTNSDPDQSAMMDVQSTDKGMLMPRMTTDQRDAIPNPVAGLMIFNLTDSCFNYYLEDRWVKDCGRSLDVDVNSSSKHFGGSDDDYGLFVDTDAAGNIYVGGSFEGDLKIGDDILSNSSGDNAFYLAKLAPSGEALWNLQFGGNGDEIGIEGISVDASGNIFITGGIAGTVLLGSTSLTASNIADIFFAKYDSDGNLIWAKQAGIAGLGFGNAITTDASGNVFVIGSELDLATGFSSVLINKYDASGNFLWSRKSTANGDISGTEVTTDPLGNVAIVGTISTGSTVATLDTITFNNIGAHSLFVAKFNSTGDALWVRLGGGSSGFGLDVGTDSGGNVYVMGNFIGPTTLGGTYLGNSPFARTIGIGKFDPNGNLTWGELVLGVNLEGSRFDIDPSGNVFFTGDFEANTNFGGSVPTITSVGSADIVVGKYDTNGNILWAKQAGGLNPDAGRNIAVNTSGDVFVIGVFLDSATIGDQSYVGTDRDAFLWMLQGDNGDDFKSVINNLSGYQDLYNDVDPTNEWQNLSLSGDDLSIENGNSVDVSSIDNQTLSLSGTILSIDNGNSIDLSAIDKDDDNQNLNLSGNNLSIVNGNTIDLSGVGSDNQMLIISGTALNITNGTGVGLHNFDTDTDNQTLNLSGNILSIEDGNNVDLSTAGSDNQTIGIFGNTLTLSGGNTVNISSIDTDTDDQTLSLSGQDLTILDGNTINLNSVNTDNQTLSLSGTTLSISNGNSVTLPSLPDDLGNHISTQNLEADGYFISGDGDSEGVFVHDNGNVGIGTNTPAQKLHVKTSGSTVLEYGLLVQNPFDPSHGRIGILFSGDSGNNLGKGGLVYHGRNPNGTGDFEFLQAPNLMAGNPNINDIAMVIKQNGNVGIGKEDPVEKLEVAGNLQLEKDFAKLTFFSEKTYSGITNTLKSEIRTNINPPTNLVIGGFPGAGDQYMTFYVAKNFNGGLETVMRLQGDGNIGVGGNDSVEALLEITDVLPEIRLTARNNNWSAGSSSLERFNFFTRDSNGGGYTNTGSIDMVVNYNTTINGPAHNSEMSFQTAINGSPKIQMLISPEGRIGIGTTSPQTFLHVRHDGLTATGSANYFQYSFGSGTTLDASSRSDVVAYFEGDIVASAGITAMSVGNWSDARAKEIIQRSNSQEDLKLLNQIQITDYRWIDSLEDHGRTQKKIIAQEVEEILPNAVSRMYKAIPNVYQQASRVEYDEAKEELTIYLSKNHEFKAGDKVRLFTETEDLEKVEVKSIGTSSSFTISAKPANGAFVYGKWVDDYRKVDYDALSMLNINATKEQQRVIEAQAKEIEARRQLIEQQAKELEELLGEKKTQEVEIHALESRFQVLEALMDKSSNYPQINK